MTLLAVLASMACSDGPSYYAPSGVQQDVEETDLDGWTPCFEEVYDDTGSALADVLAACDGDRLLLACGPVGETAFALLAQGKRADVLFDCGSVEDCFHVANGVAWYYSDDSSWGFLPPSAAPPVRDSCDDDFGEDTELRMCWHTNSGYLDPGYRCGDNDLNSSGEWRRSVYTR